MIMKKMLIALTLGLGISSVSFGMMNLSSDDDGIEFEDEGMSFENLSDSKRRRLYLHLMKEVAKSKIKDYDFASVVANFRPFSLERDFKDVASGVGCNFSALVRSFYEE